MTLPLEGDANDYVGKGLSGGKLIIYPARRRHLRGRGEHDHRQRRALRRDRRRGLHPRHGRRTLRRPQLRRQRRRRGRRRPRLRIHDRRPRRRARPRPAATSPPACPAASPTSSTRPATSPRACNPQMVGVEKLETPAEIAEVRSARSRTTIEYTKSTARPRQSSPTGTPSCRSSSRSCRRTTSACSPASRRPHGQGLTGDEAIMAAFEENARDTSRVGGN